MTPKEKALELCNKFMICNSYQAIVWHNARICALIAVDEILAYQEQLLKNYNVKLESTYWYKVKQQINNL